MTIERIGATKSGAGGQPLPFSPAVRAGDFIYVSGQIAMMENGELEPGGIESQTRRTMENLRKVLELAGCTLMMLSRRTAGLMTPATSGPSTVSTPNHFRTAGPRGRPCGPN